MAALFQIDSGRNADRMARAPNPKTFRLGRQEPSVPIANSSLMPMLCVNSPAVQAWGNTPPFHIESLVR